MTTVAPATPAAASLYSTGAARTPTQTYNSDMFLKLLVTQLQNQDPSSPMDSGAMIQQTSQLASMEQLTALTKASTEGYALQMRSAAANIIGREVTWTDADGVAKSGTATAVTFTGDTPTITVGSDTVALDALTGVKAA